MNVHLLIETFHDSAFILFSGVFHRAIDALLVLALLAWEGIKCGGGIWGKV